MSSSGSSSASSPPRSPSPGASVEAPLNVERLVDHFVAAKRSLGATQRVWEANDLVTRSRSLIEQIAVLNARNEYVRHGVDEQINALNAIRNGIANAEVVAERQLQTHIATLDAATKRLEETIQKLKGTIVHSALQRLPSIHPPEPEEEDVSPNTSEAGQGEKTLYDFVDEAQHEDILTALRGHVDSFFEDARASLAEQLDRLDESIRNVRSALPTSRAPSRTEPVHRSADSAAVTHLFRGLEQNAAQMANLLQSLITHYDLCVTALKHTQGGGEAAKVAVQAEHLSKDTPSNEESLYGQTVAEPISDEERAEMLGVVENDSQEVDDVVAEIQEHATEMHEQFERLEQVANTARSHHDSLRRALSALRMISNALPTYIAASTAFNESWHAIQQGIETKTVALDEVTDFYAQFVTGYERLLHEIRRREAHAEKMRAVATKANRDLERLWDADQDARRHFFDEVGGHLPRDLYPALLDKGVKWEVRAVQTQHADEGGDDDFDENYDTSITQLRP